MNCQNSISKCTERGLKLYYLVCVNAAYFHLLQKSWLQNSVALVEADLELYSQNQLKWIYITLVLQRNSSLMNSLYHLL